MEKNLPNTTQSELAEALRPYAIGNAKVETGVVDPRASTLRKILRATKAKKVPKEIIL